MSDFFQNGIITTLHNLRHRATEELEADLRRFARRRKLALVLPCLYSELERPALRHIVAELTHADYIEHIVIGLDRASEAAYRRALRYFSELPQSVHVLWNDGPRLQAVNDRLRELQLAPEERGKGCNVWYCLGYVQALQDVDAVGLHDCDIVTYDRGLVARLMYPVAHPQFRYKFVKGFYARYADGKLNGRVSRLLVSPLIRAMKSLTTESHYLDYLDSFRYPLAGEFAMSADVLYDLRIPSDWGLEIGLLSEMYRNHSTNRICQVEVSDTYDHKHQELSIEDASRGLSRMSLDIAKALFRKLATQGAIFDPGAVRSAKAAYYRIALDLIDSYANDALMNGLTLDRHREERAVELFATNVLKAGQAFLDGGEESAFIPSWHRVESVYTTIFDDLLAAAAQDAAEFGSDEPRLLRAG
ncbi:MAG: glycosyl transferase [Pseudomonadota bacterium]